MGYHLIKGFDSPGAGLLAVLHRHKEDVLGLQVCVYEIKVMQVRHALQQLLPEGPNLQMQRWRSLMMTHELLSSRGWHREWHGFAQEEKVHCMVHRGRATHQVDLEGKVAGTPQEVVEAEA